MENDVELTSEEMELANQLVRQAREHFKTHPQDHYWDSTGITEKIYVEVMHHHTGVENLNVMTARAPHPGDATTAFIAQDNSRNHAQG
ncbi:hypothetical protein RGB72_11685 [Glutamicibacter protophormiae]|nr:hypothetical protein RGB72_11685 [Glutamicibacter protophormiae]